MCILSAILNTGIRQMTIQILFVFCFSFFSAAASSEFFLNPLSTDVKSNSSKPLSCEELSDRFCRTFWSAENQGNFQFSDGTQILYGDREQNIVKNAEFIYNQKLARSRCHLPEDIKIIMGIHCGMEDKKEDILTELDSLLSQIDSIKNKKSADSWKRSVTNILSDFGRVIAEATYERSLQENPALSEKFWHEYSPTERKAFSENYYDIKKEIMDAIYSNDPNWLKIVGIFKEVKRDVLTVIDNLTLSPETKHVMKEKVSSVKISLPYADTGREGYIRNCDTYLKNAYYHSLQNTVSVCIGSVNTSNSEGSFYGMIAHEIAHSIDPLVFSIDILEQAPISQLLSQLYESNASLACADWEKRKNETFVLPSEMYQLPEGIAAIDQCLVDRQSLDELNSSSLNYVSQRIAESSIDSYASQQIFSYLTTPEIFKHGDLKNNEFYMDPKLFEESKNEYLEIRYFLPGHFYTTSVFIQEYKCRLAQMDITEEQAFIEALEETKKLNAIYQYFYFSILGRNSKKLVIFNLSKPSNEEFADWISYKVVELNLERMPSLESKRNLIFSQIAGYCSQIGLEDIAKHKTLVERNYSRRLHGLNRNRRLKSFTPKTAKLLQCIPGENIKRPDKCDFLIE